MTFKEHFLIFKTKIFKWEFWPVYIFYAPVFFYWIWVSLRSRSLFFFTSSNPLMKMGGLSGLSKYKLIESIPSKYSPRTLKFSSLIDFSKLRKELKSSNLTYPLIFKPDVGERGWMVELIEDDGAAKRYLDDVKVNFLVQEYIDYDLEFGVFYYRFPSQDAGTISSIAEKRLMNVIGDGQKNVGELLKASARKLMFLKKLKDNTLLNTVPSTHEKIILSPIGNHCRGATFLDRRYLINDELTEVFDEIGRDIDGFFYGRYDIRCKSIEDLSVGKNFKIIEINGAAAELAHIYQPNYSLFRAYKDVIEQVNVLGKVSRLNEKNGHEYVGFFKGMKEMFEIASYNLKK